MHLIKQGRSFVKLNQEIHITVGRFLLACTRTKHIDLPDLVLPCNSVNIRTLRPNCIKHTHLIFVPLGSGERPFGFISTFTGRS